MLLYYLTDKYNLKCVSVSNIVGPNQFFIMRIYYFRRKRIGIFITKSMTFYTGALQSTKRCICVALLQSMFDLAFSASHPYEIKSPTVVRFVPDANLTHAARASK